MNEAPDVRLIERWFPIRPLGIECRRERAALIPFPAPNRLHVWWARRPLVASRAAVLASLLPSSADHAAFMHILGIHGDPVETRALIDAAQRTGEDLGPNPYGYGRAFKYTPSDSERNWISGSSQLNGSRATVLDPTAGGGSIPLEAARLGFDVVANDLNPVAALLLRLTVQAPREYRHRVLDGYRNLSERFLKKAESRFVGLFQEEPDGVQVLGYLWARTITCPYCDGVVPLSPNWRLAPNGIGVRVVPIHSGGPNSAGRRCDFEIVRSVKEQSNATILGGVATCPYDDCGRIISGDEIKRQAKAMQLGEQLYATVFRRTITKIAASGKQRTAWERGYSTPKHQEVDTLDESRRRLNDRWPVWEARGIIPTEIIPEGNKTSEPLRYGMTHWRDFFNPRQLYGYCTAVELYHELFSEETAKGGPAPEIRAAFGYLALALDKLATYNCRSSRWHPGRDVMAQIFERHDFSMKWTSAEMAPLITGKGYEWALNETAKCIKELIDLSEPSLPLLDTTTPNEQVSITVTCQNAAALTHIADESVDAVIMDPPYGANVMYAELSDFFYVWLKRTAGLIYPDLFRAKLTNKEDDAVANAAHFTGQVGAAALAEAEYRKKMAFIFDECRRVLKPGGVMTLMFTHKATGAWDALAQALIEAGFVITASWPINTESESSLHIRDKAAANSTIFLVCRPRQTRATGDPLYWDDLENRVREAVRSRIEEFQIAGIRGVDLYLASFGPALQVLSEHWPVQRVAPRPVILDRKRKRRTATEHDVVDPYAVTPEDALNAARTEVKRWRLERLSSLAAREGLDPIASWFVLAWDAFESAIFPYDEALRLAHVCGVSLESDIVGRYANKKGDNVLLWDSSMRAGRHSLGSPGGEGSMLDAVHHAAHLARTRSLEAARTLLEENNLTRRQTFVAAFDAIRQVLPVSADYSGTELPANAVGAGDDFRSLEDIRKLIYATELPVPEQLTLIARVVTLRPASD